MKARAKAATLIKNVLFQSKWEPSQVQDHPQSALIKHYCFSVLRHYYFLEALLDQFVHKKFKQKDNDIKALIMIGLFELWQKSHTDHAIVNESVNACSELNKTWAKGVINATLRSFTREREAKLALIKSEQALYNHPKYLLKKLKSQWPNDWQSIVNANQVHPPMTLRVNTLKTTRQAYAKQLEALDISFSLPETFPYAICLNRPLAIQEIPKFDEGFVSVQDLSAQWAAPLLEAQPGMRILDACAAPGGKTAHLLELVPQSNVHAIEISPPRAKKLEETLGRLNLKAQIIQADATLPETWWDKTLYDRILVDAPCSGTGVIKRHPDIKLNINEELLLSVTQTQKSLLEALWPLLAPNGILLYATCSVLKEENRMQMESFLNQHPDAQWQPLALENYIDGQILTTPEQDGFFYAKLIKQPGPSCA